MKINLAENMLRFGVKNLKESDKQKLQTLTEQSNALRNSQAINKQATIAANLPELRNRGINATKGGYCIYTEVKLPNQPVNLEFALNAIFYNNMVSSAGLMQRSNAYDSITSMLNRLRDEEFEDINITIKGTATNLPPGGETESRYKPKRDVADKIRNVFDKANELRKDHGGTLYGGIDYQTDPQGANLWLAQQRSEYLAKLVRNIANNLKMKVNVTTDAEVVEGGFKDDKKRYSKAFVAGNKPTYDKERLGNPTLTYSVLYDTKQLESNNSMIQKAATTASNLDPANKNNQSKQPLSDNETVWRCEVKINFGADAIPIVVNGKNVMQIPEMAGRYSYKNKPGKYNTNERLWSSNADSLKQSYLIGADDTRDGIAVGSANLFGFLMSCGRFTQQQANKIYNDIKLVNGTLLNYARKSPGKVLTGDLNSFAAIYGGSPEFSDDLTKGGYKLDQQKLTLEKIS